MRDQEAPSTKRILSSIRRLRRDGELLLRERPLDEIAHAKWIDRADRYLRKRVPETHIAPLNQLAPVQMPNLLSPNYRKPHPADSALARADSGRRLAEKYLAICASAQERLELKLDMKTD